jgi:signal transduction histidine kinase
MRDRWDRLRSIFRFPVYESTEVRRQWLAGLLLGFLLVLVGLALLDAVWYYWPLNEPDGRNYVLSTLVAALLLAGLFVMNRDARLSRYGRALTIAFLALGILFFDSPESVVSGNSFSLFTLPILSASFIVAPAASLVTALLVTAELEIFSLIMLPGQETYPIFRLLNLAAIAVISWLAASSTERVLQTLEERVAERTEELDRTVKRLARSNKIITEYSQDLARTSERLEQANTFKSLFLRSFRDELHTPLDSILNASSPEKELSTGILRDPELARIHRNGQFLQALINYILDLSELETGTITLQREPADLVPLIRSTVRLLDEQIADKKQVIDLKLPRESARANIDRRRIQQVLVNLLSAAHKFTPDGGRIRLDLHGAKHYIQIAVSDSGPRISPEDEARLFEPFRRLGVSRRLIELHGGRIWIENPEESGAKFIMELPVDLPDHPPKETNQREPEPVTISEEAVSQP